MIFDSFPSEIERKLKKISKQPSKHGRFDIFYCPDCAEDKKSIIIAEKNKYPDTLQNLTNTNK